MSDGSDTREPRTLTIPIPDFQRALRRKQTNDGDSGENNNGSRPKRHRHVLLWIIVIYLLVANAANAYNGNQMIAEIERQSGMKNLPEFSYLPFLGLVGDLLGMAFNSVQSFLIFALVILVIVLLVAVFRKNKSDNGAHS